MSIQYRVFIRQMSLELIIGLNNWEQLMPQQIVIDLECGNNQSFVMEDVHTSIDYSAVSASIERFAKESKFKLLESFATSLSEVLHQQFNLSYLKLSIAKPFILSNSQACGITLEREFT